MERHRINHGVLRKTIDQMLRKTIKAFLSSCMECGFCNNVCPVYHALADSKFTPLSRVLLAKKLIENRVDKDQAARVLFSCLLCGACSSACPFGLDIYKIIYLARCKLALEGYGPREFVKMAEAAAKSLHSFGLTPEQVPGSENSNLVSMMDRKEASVLYVPSPVETAFMPRHVKETAEILDILGIDWTISRKVIDCGGNIGVDASRPDAGLKILLNLIDVAEELSVDEIALGACGADYKWIALAREILDELGFDTPGLKFTSVYSVIARKLRGKIRSDDRIALHDPCSMTRYIDVREAYSSIISNIKKPKLSGPYTLCCGGGGGISLRRDPFARELLLSIASRRLGQLKLLSNIIVTPCIKCYISFRTALLRQNLFNKVSVKGFSNYVLELLKKR